MQGESAAGNDIRQRMVLIHKLIEIQVILTNNKLNIESFYLFHFLIGRINRIHDELYTRTLTPILS